MAIPNCVLFFMSLAGIIRAADGIRILAIMPTPSVSHHFVYNRYLKELHSRGHDITVATPCPIDAVNMTNYRQITFTNVMDYWQSFVSVSADSDLLVRLFPEIFFIYFYRPIFKFCDMYLSHPEMIEILEKDERFDLFVGEWGIMHCVHPYMRQANNVTVGITSFALSPWTHIMLGSTSNPAYTPEYGFPYSDRMTFAQRLRNSIYYINLCVLMSIYRRDMGILTRKYFGPDVPNALDFEKEAGVVLINSHFSTNFPRPFASNLIPIGGPPFHLIGVESKSLPKDLKEFIDGAEHGVVLFSLGSNVKSERMPENKRRVFIEAFKRIKQKVLWKWETDVLPGKPGNVKIAKWFPQTDILAHPNVKAFITQGGLQSVSEATYYRIPMVVIPFFADQELNAKKLITEDVAIRVSYETLELDSFLSALKDIIDNPKYKENIARYSALTQDQPQSPMERAVWWTEYVIRHNGARHLRSPAVDMPWYQYFQLDVLAFMVAAIFLTLYITYIFIRFLKNILFKKRKAKVE